MGPFLLVPWPEVTLVVGGRIVQMLEHLGPLGAVPVMFVESVRDRAVPALLVAPGVLAVLVVLGARWWFCERRAKGHPFESDPAEGDPC